MIKMGDIITLGCLYIFRRCVFMGHPTGSKSVGFDGNLTLFCIDYTMFENHRKVSFNNASEASYILSR